MKYILALITGIIFGSIANMGFIMLSPVVIPPPDGIDTTNMEGLLQALPLMQPKHFLMPFLAHAMGTLVGAWIAARVAPTNKMTFALIIGLWFFLWGIYMATKLPTPIWFIAADLILAYMPFAYVGGLLALMKKAK
jgi:hypothetical protein